MTPTCRACYAATLTPDQRERFYAEPVTSCIYWCPEHQRLMDEVVESLPAVKMIRASESAFPIEFARVSVCECGRSPDPGTCQEGHCNCWHEDERASCTRVIPPAIGQDS